MIATTRTGLWPDSNSLFTFCSNGEEYRKDCIHEFGLVLLN